jgi:hypothetical protein
MKGVKARRPPSSESLKTDPAAAQLRLSPPKAQHHSVSRSPDQDDASSRDIMIDDFDRDDSKEMTLISQTSPKKTVTWKEQELKR